jgi:hypothetical protein
MFLLTVANTFDSEALLQLTVSATKSGTAAAEPPEDLHYFGGLRFFLLQTSRPIDTF